MKTVKYLVVHCSATPAGRNVTVSRIDKWHRERGFAKIGYHYVIYLDGTIAKGRDPEEPGAHAAGYNSQSISICYIGGTDAKGSPLDTRTPEQKASLYFLLQSLKEKYPKAKICGHRDLSPDLNGNGSVEPSEWTKQCPCFDAALEYKDLR